MATQVKDQVVAREFVETLQETAQETLKKCLEKLEAPESVKALVERIDELNYYLSNPDLPEENWGPEKFDIQTVVAETTNAIAAVGGTFSNSEGDRTVSREGTLLA
jgi:hypothetical protein